MILKKHWNYSILLFAYVKSLSVWEGFFFIGFFVVLFFNLKKYMSSKKSAAIGFIFITMLIDIIGIGIIIPVIPKLLQELNHSDIRSEEHTSELQSRPHLVCRLLLEKKNL